MSSGTGGNNDSGDETKLDLVIEDFLSVIQHRLRTPVQANLRITELLVQEAFGKLTRHQREVLQAMRENSEETERLLSMLVDIYRYKNGHMQLSFQFYDLQLFLPPIGDVLREKCLQRKLSLQLNLPSDTCRIRADKAELEKLLSHLIDNALRFAYREVNLSACKSESRDAVEITVSDDGKGIAPADIANLFTRFSQVSASGKYNAVTGAGLCLCAEIARAHGGNLGCESVVGNGATFRLLLPWHE